MLTSGWKILGPPGELCRKIPVTQLPLLIEKLITIAGIPGDLVGIGTGLKIFFETSSSAYCCVVSVDYSLRLRPRYYCDRCLCAVGDPTVKLPRLQNFASIMRLFRTTNNLTAWNDSHLLKTDSSKAAFDMLFLSQRK